MDAPVGAGRNGLTGSMDAKKHIPIAAFHTGGAYRTEARRLRASLLTLRLIHEIAEIPDRGGWTANCNAKAEFVRDRLDGLDDAAAGLLYVDADAFVHADPTEYLLSLGCDFAAHWLKGRELCSGTLFFGNTPIARHLAEHWVDACGERPGKFDQANLQTALDVTPGVRIHKLPPEYCFIFDTSRTLHPGHEPIIEHLQASRRLREKGPRA